MKKIVLATAISALTFSSLAADLDTEDKKIAYTIGVQVGKSLKITQVDEVVKLDNQLIFDGISDALADKKAQLTEEEMGKVMQAFDKKMEAYMAQKIEKQIAKNKAEATKLLAENKAKEGVKVTKSGLQYRVVKAGTGKKPTADSTVKVNYEGKLADGTKFDSSYDRKEAAEIPLSAVIKGWKEGLQLMSEGAEYEFVIPAELAYGAQAPENIGPERALIFKVELLEVK